MQGNVTEIPEGHFRSVFTGRNFGVPGYMLCYSNPPVWTFDQALAQSIIFGIMPKANDAGEPLELMSEFWKFTDNFPIEIGFKLGVRMLLECYDDLAKNLK